MKKVGILFQFVLLMVLLPSCSNHDPSSQEKQSKAKLTNIHILYYHPQSIKPQPELIDVEYESSQLLTTLMEVEEAGSEPQSVILPAWNQIKRIYILDYVYESDSITSESDHEMLLWDNDGNYYIKPFVMTSDYLYDTYNEKTKEEILHRVGSDNWKSIKPLTIFTN
ncbi:hypothetical protein [Marinicrinis sediminis]|uniref:Lipoprotein n=1 Tax=Marinicrinis sediminis TaxID=1652465 RepID=A0ABW5R8B5_9BACL